MKDFEVSAEPVQDWLSKTEKMVHESSNRLYDLPAKRREQQKLQVTALGPAARSPSPSCVHAPCPVCMLPVLCTSLCPGAHSPRNSMTVWDRASPFPVSGRWCVAQLPRRWICLCLQPMLCPARKQSGLQGTPIARQCVLMSVLLGPELPPSAMCCPPASY